MTLSPAFASTSMRAETTHSLANMVNYAIIQNLNKVNTLLPCQIVTIYEGNRYDVTPLLNNLTVTGEPVDPPTIYNVPALQTMGGNAGIIIEFQEGDTVLVGFAQRNIAAVKKNWTTQNPSSLRKFSLSDGIILANLSNNLPTIYVKVTPAGIEVTAPSLPLTVNSQTATINTTGDTVINASGDVDITGTNVTITSTDVDIGGVGAVGVLNSASVIHDSLGFPCTVVTPSATVKCTS